jgi:hypothetical protein
MALVWRSGFSVWADMDFPDLATIRRTANVAKAGLVRLSSRLARQSGGFVNFTQNTTGIFLAGVRQMLVRLQLVLQPDRTHGAAGGGGSNAEVVAKLAERLKTSLGSAEDGLGEEAEVVAEAPSVGR